jgi:hypothetical protein
VRFKSFFRDQGTAVDLIHSPTGATLFVAVYWVPHAACVAVLTAGLLFVPYYGAPLIRRWLSRLHRWPDRLLCD